MHTTQKINFIRLFIGVISLIATVESTYHVQRETCDCICKDSFMDAAYSHKPLCHVVSRLEKELLAVNQEIERRTIYIRDISELKEIMEEQGDLIRTLQEQVEKLSSINIVSEALPTPAALVMKDYMLDDPSREIRMKEEKELVDNVSNLIAKVEEVENLTSKVQEELKSERRVRRHLEEDLNETRFSIKMLDDKLLNVTLPMDSRVTHVEEIVLSSLEHMNKTLYEDHLKKLYYKVDGVVYKNETQKLDERLDQVETELMDANNINTTLKFVEELSNLADTLNTINQTIMEKLAEEETRLGSLENKTTKLDEFEVLQVQMTTLLNNISKLDELGALQDQVTNLLNKTTKLDEFESLQDQMTILLNVTEQMQTRAIDLWMDIQNVRNTTVQLEMELHDKLSINNKTVASLQQEISGKLQTLAEDLSSLKAEVVADQASLANIQADVKILSADVAVSEDKIVDLAETSEKMMKEISTKIENLTGVWDNSLSILASQIEQWKNSKDADESNNKFKDITQNKNNDEWNENDDDEIDVNLGRLRGKGPDEQVRCDLPSLNDEHLLMSLEEDNQGVQTLVFGCRPIGQYVLEKGDAPLECKDGFWHGSFPTCTRLKDEDEIIALTKELKQPSNPCLKEDGDVPDVTDCSYFFKCANGVSFGRVICPHGLRFDVHKRRCEWPQNVQCADTEAEKLESLIPTILIEPDNVDKPFGLMATNGSGHLIVYPNTNFKMHCLFPENKLGSPTWMAEQFSYGFEYTAASRNSKHRTTLEFDAISSRFNGIYTCKTPYNKKHSITIVVEAVKCPPFQVDSEREKALTYNGHPDGGERILTTTAQFFCEGGSSITAMCLPSGNWSRPVPTVEECPPKRFRYINSGPQRRTQYKPKYTSSYQRYTTYENRTHFEIQVSKPGRQYKRTQSSTTRTGSRVHGAKIWGCDVFIKQSEEDPEVKYDNHKHEIRFSCPGNKRLEGGAVASCINNSWTLSPFPKCK